jgi:hypothetical protein
MKPSTSLFFSGCFVGIVFTLMGFHFDKKISAKTPMAEEHYCLPVYCVNCGYKGDADIPKTKRPAEIQCSNCGVA